MPPSTVDAPTQNSSRCLERRFSKALLLRSNPKAQALEMELCRRSLEYWVREWGWSYDPRLAQQKRQTVIPMADLWPKQVAYLEFLEARIDGNEDGLVEKSRDSGVTWLAVHAAVHRWLFVPGFKTTFCSRKELYVDELGNPDSIFEKVRMLLGLLPTWMLPKRFRIFEHCTFMQVINPENGNVIGGEAGDQIGRGGRSSWMFIDEAAFLERGEKVDAATAGSTDCRMWASTVNGSGNIFAKKRFGGTLRPDQIFTFNWSDDPRKTADWAKKKKHDLEPHVWASEYEIDYSASVEGICIPATWVKSAQRLAKRVKCDPDRDGIGGLDVGAGKAKSVFVARFGPVVTPPVSWGDPDTIDTANRALEHADNVKLVRKDGHIARVKTLHFDSVGVGVGVLAALKRNKQKNIITVGINVGESPGDTLWSDGKTSKEKFKNLKAECWMLARERFKNSHEHLLFLEDPNQEGAHKHEISDCILLPDSSVSDDMMTLATQLSLPKRQFDETGKQTIEKKVALQTRGISSPDHAEAFILTFGRNTVDIWRRPM